MIEIGIPNLSTPAAIIDRIVIEKLKIKEFNNKNETTLALSTQDIVSLLKKQLANLFGPDKDFLVHLISDTIDLVISVGEVSYFENTKALEHKRNKEKDCSYIAHMDNLSRTYCELRSKNKKVLDVLFDKHLNIKSIQETRTF
jgi:hypothetical protein